ncbi:hypothetical protein HY990_02530 [Candidatus Micrarchaeota archaeon]|nr:hypothetical protein [Candidatus Micrarchaeota archaeon]
MLVFQFRSEIIPEQEREPNSVLTAQRMNSSYNSAFVGQIGNPQRISGMDETQRRDFLLSLMDPQKRNELVFDLSRIGTNWLAQNPDRPRDYSALETQYQETISRRLNLERDSPLVTDAAQVAISWFSQSRFGLNFESEREAAHRGNQTELERAMISNRTLRELGTHYGFEGIMGEREELVRLSEGLNPRQNRIVFAAAVNAGYNAQEILAASFEVERRNAEFSTRTPLDQMTMQNLLRSGREAVDRLSDQLDRMRGMSLEDLAKQRDLESAETRFLNQMAPIVGRERANLMLEEMANGTPVARIEEDLIQRVWDQNLLTQLHAGAVPLGVIPRRS